MEALDPRWRKSSYSVNGGGSCVEVADLADGIIAVRDSKNLHARRLESVHRLRCAPASLTWIERCMVGLVPSPMRGRT